MAFLALSLIREVQSVSVVSRGYRASLHSPARLEVQAYTCRTQMGTDLLILPLKLCVCSCFVVSDVYLLSHYCSHLERFSLLLGCCL